MSRLLILASIYQIKQLHSKFKRQIHYYNKKDKKTHPKEKMITI